MVYKVTTINILSTVKLIVWEYNKENRQMQNVHGMLAKNDIS